MGLEPAPQPGGPAGPYSPRERFFALLMLIAIIAALWALIDPPGWLRRLPQSTLSGRDIPDPVRGDPDAPLKIYEYNDFACTSCRAWHRSGIREKIVEKYSGRVVFIWRDFPVSSQLAHRAAEAAQCASDQGKFWEYHDYLYEQAESFMDEKLVEYAGQTGLDVKKFDTCFIGGDLRDKVLRSREAGYDIGVRTAVTLVINGELFVRPSSFEGLNREIDEALLELDSGPGDF